MPCVVNSSPPAPSGPWRFARRGDVDPGEFPKRIGTSGCLLPSGSRFGLTAFHRRGLIAWNARPQTGIAEICAREAEASSG
jgi:hypothetical protein